MKAFLLTLTITISTSVLSNTSKYLAYSFISPVEVEQVTEFINKQNPSLKDEVKKEITVAILDSSSKYRIEKEILLSIIAVESSFKPKAVSKTGDFSIVQINYRTWEKEFMRIKKKKLCFTQLNSDISYSIDLMGEILSHLKLKYHKKDAIWFARYHSKTPSLKKLYFSRLVNKKMLGNLPMYASH